MQARHKDKPRSTMLYDTLRYFKTGNWRNWRTRQDKVDHAVLARAP